MSVNSMAFAAVLSAAVVSPALGVTLSSQRNTLTSEAAQALADACASWAAENGIVVSIAVVDMSGALLEFHRMEGASVITSEVAPLKAKTALRWRRPSRWVSDLVKAGTQEPVWLGDFAEQGGLPVILNNQAIGAIGVAGSGPKDEPCARTAIEEVAGAKAGEDAMAGVRR